MDPEFTKPHESQAVSVSLEEGAKEALQLAAIPVASLPQQ
jgi:hypothetical protein